MALLFLGSVKSLLERIARNGGKNRVLRSIDLWLRNTHVWYLSALFGAIFGVKQQPRSLSLRVKCC